MKNAIIKELTTKGYNATLTKVTKNGVVLDSIIIREENNPVAPNIYIDEIIANESDLDSIVAKVIKLYEANKNPGFNLPNFKNYDYTMSHVVIALQRTGNENLIKRDTDFEGIEQYLIVADEGFSYKITNQLVKELKLDIDTLWKVALENTRNNVKISSMAEMLGMPELMSEDMPYVLTNKSQNKGASSLLCSDLVEKFARNHNFTKVVVIPSSIHEVLLYGSKDEVDLDCFNAMVNDVNSIEVAPIEQLADRVFVLEF